MTDATRGGLQPRAQESTPICTALSQPRKKLLVAVTRSPWPQRRSRTHIHLNHLPNDMVTAPQASRVVPQNEPPANFLTEVFRKGSATSYWDTSILGAFQRQGKQAMVSDIAPDGRDFVQKLLLQPNGALADEDTQSTHNSRPTICRHRSTPICPSGPRQSPLRLAIFQRT